jgi:hypothetical protein
MGTGQSSLGNGTGKFLHRGQGLTLGPDHESKVATFNADFNGVIVKILARHLPIESKGLNETIEEVLHDLNLLVQCDLVHWFLIPFSCLRSSTAGGSSGVTIIVRFPIPANGLAATSSLGASTLGRGTLHPGALLPGIAAAVTSSG